MLKSLPVVAAIPNYNMARSLGELLPQVACQNYTDIFVLDDASTDASRDVVRDFNTSVRFVAGTENVGAGANRNRILGVLGHDAIIHFIDADMHLETASAPEIAQEVAASCAIGFVGGLIKQASGHQHPFNYGPRQCMHTSIASNVQARLSALGETDPAQATLERAKHHKLLNGYPNPLAVQKPHKVFWSAEANLLIRSDVLAAIGGFDPRLRDHEIQDLALRMSQKGLERRFDPTISAVHKAVLVRTGNRNVQMAKAEWRIARKHGLLNWLLPDGHFRPTL